MFPNFQNWMKHPKKQVPGLQQRPTEGTKGACYGPMDRDDDGWKHWKQVSKTPAQSSDIH